jgi:hypothetical protein
MNINNYLFMETPARAGKTLPVGDLRNSNPRVSTRLSTTRAQDRKRIFPRRSADDFRDRLREFVVAENSSGR